MLITGKSAAGRAGWRTGDVSAVRRRATDGEVSTSEVKALEGWPSPRWPRAPPAQPPCRRRTRPSSWAGDGSRRCRRPSSTASCRSAWSDAPRSPRSPGDPAVRNSTSPWLNTPTRSPSTYEMLAAGASFSCRAFAADADVVNTHRACRKCPSTALIRGSPCAVTVARFSVHIPVRTCTSSSESSRRGPVMMLRRCSVDRSYAASRSACSW